MSDYNKLRTILGTDKTLSSELISAGVREENPYDFRDTDLMFSKKSQWDNVYQMSTNNTTSATNHQIEIINGEGWVGNHSLGIRVPRLDGAGNRIVYKPCALLYLISRIQVKIGSTEIMSYDNYALFNALFQANSDEVKKELLYLLQPNYATAGEPVFEVEDDNDVQEIRVPIFAPGTTIELNRNDDKPRPFPLGKCQGNMIFRIELNDFETCIDEVLDSSTAAVVAYTPVQAYDAIRLYYDKYVIQGEAGAVVDEGSTTRGNALYPYFSLEGFTPNTTALNNSAMTQVSVVNLRKDGELTAVLFSVILDSDLAKRAFSNSKVNGLAFKLGNDTVYEQDSSFAIQSQYLLQNRSNAFINTMDAGFYDPAKGGSALMNIPFSRQPLEPFESQFYGVNPDKLQMNLSLRVKTAGSYTIPCTGLYKTMIAIRGGMVVRLFH